MFRYPTPSVPREAGYAIAGDRFAILVAAHVGDGVVARLWNAAAAETAVLEDVLSVLVAGGIHSLPDFAVAEFPESGPEPLRVAVRGSAVVETSAHARIVGADARTWVETAVAGADGIRLALAGAPAGHDLLPLGLGVARADELSWGRPFAAGHAEDPAAPGVVEPLTEAIVLPTTPPAPPLRGEEPDVLQTISIDRSLFARPLDEEDDLPDFLRDAPDDRTLLGSRAAAPAPARAAAMVLILSGGGVVPLDRPVVLGRAPRPGRHTGARIERVPSPRKEVSGTHLEATLDGETLIVRDLDSTNGTIVRPPTGAAALLRGGAASRVVRGTELDLGDGVTVLFDVQP
ncbi:FHA domain-containing protein [Microbacterium sp. EYE_5]|uniref:FHA domain-containing protein n=1 Tax=unclassified Microbacterium TaxID=2609290 RepID=UPI00200392D8|nr:MULTISPECIES: FHA domain-containing protein [unclassified Microbacterium]MCK6081165.1 FHA domain-containing protein [Microbacterium sp. EYE_382]MCK6086435.1 FHA domain-containing protein [Microbacterium sp. EYE_384]MCK6124067.1 FHA domain-containing protein [Microbacterium sp. EYE_80]MCK6126976.1 FHA domain-containing protein [Microbacterium sp. EYE_79]MCK6142120.1 FHA domain-containing protein [Microbacterium sp. EYE_39]